MSAGYLSGIVQRARAAAAAPVAPSPAARAPRRAVGPASLEAPPGPRRAAPIARAVTRGASPVDAVEPRHGQPASTLPPAPTRVPVRMTELGTAPVARAALTVTPPERQPPAAIDVTPESGRTFPGPGGDAAQPSQPAHPATPSSFLAAGKSERAVAVATVAPVVAPLPETRSVVREAAPRSAMPHAPAVRPESAPNFRVRLPEDARSLAPAVRLEVERAVRRAARAELERRAPSSSGPVEITVGHVTVELNAPLAPPPTAAAVRPAVAAVAPAPAGEGGLAALFLARNLSSW